MTRTLEQIVEENDAEHCHEKDWGCEWPKACECTCEDCEEAMAGGNK
jgi:hypothetical protein